MKIVEKEGFDDRRYEALLVHVSLAIPGHTRTCDTDKGIRPPAQQHRLHTGGCRSKSRHGVAADREISSSCSACATPQNESDRRSVAIQFWCRGHFRTCDTGQMNPTAGRSIGQRSESSFGVARK